MSVTNINTAHKRKLGVSAENIFNELDIDEQILDDIEVMTKNQTILSWDQEEELLPHLEENLPSVSSPVEYTEPAKPLEDAADKENSKTIVKQISENIKQVADDIEKMVLEQRKLVAPVQKEIITSFEAAYKELNNKIQAENSKLNTLIDTSVLDPVDLDATLQLLNQVHILSSQNDLLLQELYTLVQKGSWTPSVALVYVSQPFPTSVFKGKKLDGPLILQLLTGAKTEIQANSPIKAEVHQHPSYKAKNNKPVHIAGAEGNIGIDRILKLDHITFPDGSNNLPIQLKFAVKLVTKEVGNPSAKTASVSVETRLSKPLIVKTNEKQWEKAEGILLVESTFGEKREVTWEHFANFFYRSYLVATRQNPQEKLERPLSPFDFHYINQQKFGAGRGVTVEQVEQFWGWIGPMLHKIRYTRHIGTMFISGYICGFLSSTEVQEVLNNQEVGTFVVRFSERQAAGLVISYQAAESSGVTKVRHYQIKADDIYASTKTLPDFLADYRDLKKMLQIRYEDYQRNVYIMEKDRALKELYTKKSSGRLADGYDDEIVVLAKNLEL